MRLRLLLTREDGASAVIVAILIIVLFGFSALAVDVARLYAERRELQRTADATVLAGAREFRTAAADPVTAATSAAQSYVGQNPTTYHDGGYNEAGVSGSDFVQAFGADGSPDDCTYEGIAYDCVVAHIESPAESGDYPNGFSYYLAKVIGVDDNPVSAEATAVIGAGAPGGEKLVPWMVLDCPNPAAYPDETVEVWQQVVQYNPSCTYPGGYPVSDDFDNGARVELYLDGPAGNQGNFQGSVLEAEPGCPLIDGLFKGAGGADYRDFLAGEGSPDVVPCPIGTGARIYSGNGVKIGPTKQGLSDRGVTSTNCTSKDKFLEAVDPGVIGDGFVTIKDANPCLIVLLLTVQPDPVKSSQWDTDVSGGCCVSQWQDPDPLDVEDGRFSRFGNGKKAVIVRRFGLFYLTELGGPQDPYKGLFMRAVDSGDSALDNKPCTADTALCVVKLVH
jgi:hypothetical protein